MKNKILEQIFLYRGTNDLDFKKKGKEGIYYGLNSKDNGLITSTSIDLVYAMFAGINRCNDAHYQRKGASKSFTFSNRFEKIQRPYK